MDANNLDMKHIDNNNLDMKEILTSDSDHNKLKDKDNDLTGKTDYKKGNDKDLNGKIDDKDAMKTDEAKSNQSANNKINNQSNTTVKDNKTSIKVKNASVVKEKKLNIQLVDSKNKAIANRKVIIKIAKKTYVETTDKKGKVSLKISLDPGKYTVNVKFDGDENYTKASETFTMNVYKLKTKFEIPYTSIIRGKYFYAYLKDKNGASLSSKSVTIIYRNKIYAKKTDKNGRIRFIINSKPGKYNIKLKYKGSKTYINVIKSLTIKSYNTKSIISFDSKKVKKDKCLHINLLYHTNEAIANQKLTINFSNKKYKRTTNEKGKAYLRLSKPFGTYKITVNFNGAKGFKKSSISAKINIIPNYYGKISAKSKTKHIDSADSIKYYIRFVDSKGNPIRGEKLRIKVKCNNFTAGTGRKITKKTIVLSSDGIINKKVDKQRLNDMAKLLRAKGYKVIVSGIGPNYHVSDVKKYKNVCVFSLVGGIDSGMFVDMASKYYQNYLKKNNNQFVLGCLITSTKANLANKIWLERAHDDNYSPKSFKGMYFPGKYLNEKVHVDYVYGSNAKELVNNFIKYAKKGKSIGAYNSVPGSYTTYKLTTSKNGYVHINLPIGKFTVISYAINKNYKADSLTTWANVVK